MTLENIYHGCCRKIYNIRGEYLGKPHELVAVLFLLLIEIEFCIESLVRNSKMILQDTNQLLLNISTRIMIWYLNEQAVMKRKVDSSRDKGLLSEAILALEAELLKNPDNAEGSPMLVDNGLPLITTTMLPTHQLIARASSEYTFGLDSSIGFQDLAYPHATMNALPRSTSASSLAINGVPAESPHMPFN
ncbi:hypothetical protein Tco_0638198 [Tanacetum coccineum]